jgi:formylglycine-generating enzyme required for sulfatase activity
MLIAFKLKLALACVAGLATPMAVAPLVSDMTSRGSAGEPAIVEIAAGSLAYRASGDFTRAGQQTEAPLRDVSFAKSLTIMQHQVSAADFQRCVQDGACRALDRAVTVADDLPAVQVSWHDAQAYAGWLSRKTGKHWRLPSDEEWAFAAGSKFRDDGVPVDANDPAKRWISRYERESDRDLSDTAAYPFGKFGVNEHGVLDLAGNVWEWTSTCFVRSKLDETGKLAKESPNCGVRVAEGAHRAYVTDFIRDARAGGCAAGVPPANLGFRLVREETSWVASLSGRLSKAWARS